MAYYPGAFTYDSWYVTPAFSLLRCLHVPFRREQNTWESVRSQVSSFSFNSVQGRIVSPSHIHVGITNTSLEPQVFL